MDWKCHGWLLLLVAVGGCSAPAARQSDAPGFSPPNGQRPIQAVVIAPPTGLVERRWQNDACSTSGVRLAADDEPIAPGVRQPPAERGRRVEVPSDLPGAEAPPIRLPRFDPANPDPRRQAVAKLFPELPALGPDHLAQPAANVRPLSLGDLEEIARQHSPAIRQAMTAIRAANGAAIQAGLYPNPNFGYEADNIDSANTAGFQGGFFEQSIKTAGKLKLARAAAQVGVANAQVALRKAQVDLAHQVRATYFAVLVAQENVRISRSLAKFSDDAYQVQVDMTKGGQAAVYEPMQLRVLAFQARSNLIQARNRYIAGWKQLAAAVGVPGLPPTPLAGGVDAAVPLVRFDAALAQVLSRHTDVITAENNIQQARINVQLAYANRVPDVQTHVAIQKDYTAPPFNTCVNVAISAPVPLWDRNQGNIEQAEAQLNSAIEGPHATRDDLTNRLADAFERYDDNRVLIEYYRQQILPDQVQAFRGARERYDVEPDVVAFSDIVNAQQTLATTVTSYVTVLGSLWTAVSDLAALLEAEDLFRMGQLENVPAVPDLEQLCPLPCCHPSALWQNPQMQRGDPRWPAAAK
jgi:outer membrane protein, heavy metal efflux system